MDTIILFLLIYIYIQNIHRNFEEPGYKHWSASKKDILSKQPLQLWPKSIIDKKKFYGTRDHGDQLNSKVFLGCKIRPDQGSFPLLGGAFTMSTLRDFRIAMKQ